MCNRLGEKVTNTGKSEVGENAATAGFLQGCRACNKFLPLSLSLSRQTDRQTVCVCVTPVHLEIAIGDRNGKEEEKKF